MNSLSMTALDGGYGWIIVLASFFANVIVDGTVYSIGETLVELWKEYFQTTTAQASIGQSLLAGSYLLAGPFASGLSNLFGCRLVAIAGSIITFAGFLISSFVPSLPLLYITFGIVGGFGFGLVYLPSLLIVNHYFEKRRAFATGIAVCGSGVGTTIFSQLFPFLLRACENKWRCFLIYTAFITLLTIICGLCYRKMPSVRSKMREVKKVGSSSNLSGEESDREYNFSTELGHSMSSSALQQELSQETEGIRRNWKMKTRMTKETISGKARGQFPLCTILRSMIDTSLLRDSCFILIAFTAFLTFTCIFVPFIFLGKQASKIGANSKQQSYLLLLIGIMNILGRILSGLITDLLKVDPLFVHNLGIIIGGIATCIVPLLTQYWMLVIYTIPFAWSIACFASLRTIICVELFGLENLSNVLGMMMLSMGIAAFIGPPFAALLKDMSGNFDLSFYVMGSLLTMSGILCIPLRTVKSRMSNRR